MGQWLMRKSWVKISADFNPGTGNHLVFGLLALALIPSVVWWANRP